MNLKSLLWTVVATLTTGNINAQNFEDNFHNKTLRLDYISGANPTQRYVMLSSQATLPHWAGRTHNLNQLPLEGNIKVNVMDSQTGDTIYRTSLSSLYNEWLATEEAKTTPRAFQNTILVPLPKRNADIEIVFYDDFMKPMASMKHTYRIDDILVKPKGEKNITPHKYLHKSSNPQKAIDVAILAEGYTVEEMDSFYRHAQNTVDAILSYDPFKKHADHFNFVAVASPSQESGVSVPRLNDWKNTAFNSHYSTFYSDRYLTTPELTKVHDALAGIPYEHIIILANTPEYGGGGIYNSYTLSSARHATFKPVIVHEFGHSFGGLADEYFYENDPMESRYPRSIEPWEPNITTLVNFKSKWEDMLPKGTPVPTDPKDAKKYTVGVYEGAGYSFHGVYRPADECRMRNNTYPTFCPVCTRAIDRLIEFYIE